MSTNVKTLPERIKSEDWLSIITNPSDAYLFYKALRSFQRNYNYESPIYDVDVHVAMIEDLRSYFITLHLEHLESQKADQ